MRRCEWDPTRNEPARVRGWKAGDREGCPNEATVSVGRDGMWRLCESCAALPAFDRFTSRRPLVKPGDEISS